MTQQKLLDAGSHKAYFNRYIIAGKHVNEGYQGAPDTTDPMVILGWELPEDLTDEGLPRWVKTFGAGAVKDFNGNKSKKTEIFTGMFEDYVPRHSDAASYLGKPCRLMFTHNTSKTTGKTYAKISGWRDYEGDLVPISKPPVFFDFYNPTQEDLDKLFPWEIDYLREATDFQGSKLEEMLANDTRTAVEKDEQQATEAAPF